MAFYHWLGPAVKGWTSGKKEKEEHDLESSLKRIKMQQLVDEMSMSKTRFGQEQKGWAAEDAKNAYDVWDYGEGGNRRRKSTAELENELLLQEGRKFDNSRKPIEAAQADELHGLDVTSKTNANTKSSVDAKYAEDMAKAELAELKRRANEPYRSYGNGPSTPKVPPMKVPERFKAMQKELDSINKTIAMSGGADKYVAKFPGMRQYFKGKEGVAAQPGYFGSRVGSSEAVPSTLQFDESSYLRARGMEDYMSPETISGARASVDRDIEQAAAAVAQPGEAVHLGNGGAAPQAPAPTQALAQTFMSTDPNKMKFGPRGVMRTASNAINGGIYDIADQVQSLISSGQMTPLAAQQYWLQVRNNLYDLTTNANSEDVALRLLQVLESQMSRK